MCSSYFILCLKNIGAALSLVSPKEKGKGEKTIGK